MLSETARAKVNLFLHVLGRRPDGYHLLDSLAVFPDAADFVRAEAADELELIVEGPFAQGLEGENLVMRAARALQRAGGGGHGARIVLEKNLPVASGIGGGSADAAAALRLLNRLWSLALAPAELAQLALELGADVPVCLLGEPARMGGVGELLGTAPALPAFGMVLVNPGVPVSTADVFRSREESYSEAAVLPARWADAAAMAADLTALTNDLEAPALRVCPAVAEVLAWLRQLPGCRLARMSGSGGTCFGVFDDGAAAAAAAERAPPVWWRWGGPVA